ENPIICAHIQYNEHVHIEYDKPQIESNIKTRKNKCLNFNCDTIN
ncbi:12524_t:CDS:1, partial [Dentiscutata heterogama]